MATVDTQLPATVGTGSASHENENGQTRGRGNGRRPNGRGRGGAPRPHNRNNNGNIGNNGTGDGTNGPPTQNSESRGGGRGGRLRKPTKPRNGPQPTVNTTGGSRVPANNTSPTSDSFPRQEGRNESIRGGRGGSRGRGGRGRGGSNAAPRSGPAHNGGVNGVGPKQAPTAENKNVPAARSSGPHRRFGGELTTESQTEKFDEDDTTDLPEEKPAATQATSKQPKAPRERKPQPQKEGTEMMARIHKDISSGNHECMVCFGGVTRRSKIWDCKVCYTVFHLNCIQKWAQQAVNAPSREEGADEPAKMWRCPGCQNKLAVVPSTYQCWCGKQKTPEAVKYLPPHSCGQTCGKKRPSPALCPHPCDLQCHAGPCPPCLSMGPVQSCFCGKETAQRRCSETPYKENGWTCGKVCDSLMPCGIHKCNKPCHQGPCGDCPETEVVKCYCGKESKTVKCSQKNEPKTSVEIKDGEFVEWKGYYHCASDCEKFFDCNIHKCQKPCHPQEPTIKHCPLSPDVVQTCPCGKTPLRMLGIEERHSCTDPIPKCDKVCNKKLPCGHPCQKKCHEGDCGICMQTVEVACRCGKTFSNSLCLQDVEFERPICMRSCRVMLNCQRHECGEKCCPGEKKAMERLSRKKPKARPLGSANPNIDEGFEPEHICTRTCGKLLKCGTHHCPMLCHRGPCHSCLEASWEELTCHCGRTSIQPPVRCGTQPPPCTHPCTRPKPCNHPAISPHNCHQDSVKCPPCTFLVDKVCLCGKKTIRSQPCFSTSVSCATKCGRLLSCGSHTCQKLCHKPGECEEPCPHACGKARSNCGHPCTERCHAPFVCAEDKPCTARLVLTCECGGIKQEAKCGATKTTPGNKKTLKCADACRSRRLALAFEQNPDGEGSAAKGYSDETVDLYKENPRWAAEMEQTLRDFLSQPTKRLNFKPMRKPQRGFIHYLAEDFGLISESQDPEPYRSVAVSKPSARTPVPPRKTILEFIKTKAATQAAETAAAAATAPLLAQLKKPTKKPYNAFILNRVRVGVLQTELESTLEPALKTSRLLYTIKWVADEDVTLEPKSSSLSADELERDLLHLKPILKQLCASTGIASSVEMCFIISGRVLYKEGEKADWNVVTRGTPVVAKPKTFTSLNSFSVLSNGGAGSSVAGPSKPKVVEKPKPVEVVDDWEAEAEEEERKEEEEMKAKAEEESHSEGESKGKGKEKEGESDGERDWSGKEEDETQSEADKSETHEFHEAVENLESAPVAQEEEGGSQKEVFEPAQEVPAAKEEEEETKKEEAKVELE
ncbi:hypothetical protein BJ508DRAFT_239239 [Ascobolus immersus RN42]|uniref:R3H domain-containing protein n=1 Tax=Ascobolus immersus RN42 TaxID=1160509 RepID=A0A3N4I990_ASCIM|nr:hypothetical protein BJ508DRAFT_239239 [Ascobolus immersus RN42]